MNPAVAVVLIGIISAAMVIMLGAVQTARTRAMTRRRLDEAIPDTTPMATLGTLSHRASDDRVRQAASEVDSADVRQALDDARTMEDRA